MDWILMTSTVVLVLTGGALGYYQGFTRGFRHGQWELIGELMRHAEEYKHAEELDAAEGPGARAA